eukprot:2394445-Rhodomonas_salina.1
MREREKEREIGDGSCGSARGRSSAGAPLDTELDALAESSEAPQCWHAGTRRACAGSLQGRFLSDRFYFQGDCVTTPQPPHPNSTHK